jgi:hypothetical protein
MLHSAGGHFYCIPYCTRNGVILNTTGGHLILYCAKGDVHMAGGHLVLYCARKEELIEIAGGIFFSIVLGIEKFVT